MELYSCKVRLGGSLMNEVRKDEVTIPEIVVLKHIHGDDAVVEIKKIVGREASDPNSEDVKKKPVHRSERAERDRLRALYDPNDRFLTRDLFGHGALPQAIDGLLGAVVPDETPVRRRLARTSTVEPVDAAEMVG